MTTETKNEKGLVKNQDDAIFVSKDIFEKNWQVLRTKFKSCQASVMFVFDTGEEAMNAGRKIAEAIGGMFYGVTDPRK